MALVSVPIFGAVIGIAVNLFDYIWGGLREFCGWFDVHPIVVLALGAVGGAAAISAEFWAAVALWQSIA